jgi:hypothetical protein
VKKTEKQKKHRKKGSGSLVKRGSIYYMQYMINGKRKQVSLGVTTEREAEKKAKEILDPLKTADTKEKIAVYVAEARKLTKGLL